MNQFKLKVTVLTLALIMAATAVVFAQYSPESDFETTFHGIDNSSPKTYASISKYTGNDSVVKIPPTIKGLPVISVSFWKNNTITSITIPDSVTYISLHEHTALTCVTIPNSVTAIGSFSGCTALTSITMSKGVTKIDSETFKDCKALTSITIPAGVTKIGRNAFEGCTSLKSITIPANVTEIGLSSFRFCSSLTTVTVQRESKGKDFSGTRIEGHIAFIDTPANMVIKVPKNSVKAYQENWSFYSDKIK